MLERIAAIVRDHKGDDTLAVAENTTFTELGLDSLDTIELVMSVEEEFSVTIEMSADIKTVGDLMRIINADKIQS